MVNPMKNQNPKIALATLLLAGCVGQGASSGLPNQKLQNVLVPTKQNTRPYQKQNTCATSFKSHKLKHISKARTGQGGVYDSNGSGVAVGDLNNDGLEDIVLGNLAGASQVFWNEGHFHFRNQELFTNLEIPESQVRAVQIVDVNSDGWQDIALTHTTGGFSVLLNDHHGKFKNKSPQGISTPAYTMLWDDLYGDGNLELVTASYDAMLEAEMKDSFLLGSGGGVVIYKNNKGAIKRTDQLSSESQTLALALFDVDGDGRRDLIVANDFAVPDWAWLNTKAGWKKTKAFTRISKNTMSFSISDVQNNGNLSLFSTDMKPNFNNTKALAAWMPFMQRSFERLQNSSNQRAENAFQSNNKNTFQNKAYQMGIDATGWSWSSQFGDLDNDGFEDLYVVNGMIDKENLKYLPNHELVEQNKVFKNNHGAFQVMPNWDLAATASGRGMVMTDLDNDGRLDIVVNNLEQPASIFENQLCNGNSLETELNWLGTQNPNALGAKIILQTSEGTLQRQVVSQSGYLSGDSARLHFGFAKNTRLLFLEVHWPDGKISRIEKPQPNQILKISRGETL